MAGCWGGQAAFRADYQSHPNQMVRSPMAQGMAESRLLGFMELGEGAGPGQGPCASLRCWKEALSCTWLSMVPECGGGGYWGATSQLRPASGKPVLGWVGPSMSLVGRPGLSLGSPSRNDVGGERRPAKPEKEHGGLSVPGEAVGCSSRLHPWHPGRHQPRACAVLPGPCMPATLHACCSGIWGPQLAPTTAVLRGQGAG